jgi:hypothetical protein
MLLITSCSSHWGVVEGTPEFRSINFGDAHINVKIVCGVFRLSKILWSLRTNNESKS